MADRSLFPPTTLADLRERGWDAPDFVFVSGDAYVDHPSFGCAILTRILEHAGYRVAVLAQPDWHSTKDFKRFGRPLYGFFVSSGVIDSMVNHYTAAKKKRSSDVYTPGGAPAKRPDRAVIVYSQMIRQAYGDIPIVIGGVEASLRRFAHYDYWEDRVRPSILVESGADLLLFGMGERTILTAAEWMSRGAPPWECQKMRGACYLGPAPMRGSLEIASCEECQSSKRKYAEAFLVQYDEQDPFRGRPISQKHGDHYVIQTIPDPPLTQAELDEVYCLPFTRNWHPDYDALGGVPAIEEVKFSIAHTRGCFGSCSFCAITFLQGRIVTTRSHESILEEARVLTKMPDFKGYIHDVGGPTANFRRAACDKQLKYGACKNRQCLFPKPCKNLVVDHTDYIQLLRKIRQLPGIKKVFIRSGLRYDYIMADPSDAFLRELCQYHISGQLKVAPEHVSPKVLAVMGKPGRDIYDRFCERYAEINRSLGKKQYLVPYLISSHPGSDLSCAIELAEYLRDINHMPEQVQDFYPTPGTLSTCMFYTGLDPRTMKPVYIPRDPHEKAMQRALLQFRRPENYALVREALRKVHREDLIGNGRNCLVPMEGQRSAHDYAVMKREQKQKAAASARSGRQKPGSHPDTKGQAQKTARPEKAGKGTHGRPPKETASKVPPRGSNKGRPHRSR
ncbi:MAG: YgiQ family radical SAM protein [Clostridia bacterium]|nr:YgiQ family radical SAM protein [Clostridia bacterium]